MMRRICPVDFVGRHRGKSSPRSYVVNRGRLPRAKAGRVRVTLIRPGHFASVLRRDVWVAIEVPDFAGCGRGKRVVAAGVRNIHFTILPFYF